MLNQIHVDDRVFSYEEIRLFNGRKVINRDVCKENLLRLKLVLDLNNIDFGLIYGTLLGAVRENNFIEHDEDVDIYVLAENREKFLLLLWQLKAHDLNVVRYTGDLLSLMCNDDYIDVYFFKKNNIFNRVCGSYSVQKKHFKSFERLEFLGTTFNVPYKYKDLLVKLYGKNWHIPIRGLNAKANRLYPKFIRLLKRTLPKTLFLFVQNVFRKIKPISK